MAALPPFFGRIGAGLAIDGDDPGRNPGQRCDPGDEAALELLGIQRGEDIAQVIV